MLGVGDGLKNKKNYFYRIETEDRVAYNIVLDIFYHHRNLMQRKKKWENGKIINSQSIGCSNN